MNICCLLPILSIIFGNVEISTAGKFFSKIKDALDPIEIECATILKLISPSQQYDDSKVTFMLWTNDRKGDDDAYNLVPYSDESLEESKFIGVLYTYVFFNGYASPCKDKWILDSKNNILSLQDANVLTICYEELVSIKTSFITDYGPAICNGNKVSKYVAKVLNWLHEKAGLEAADIHLIGISLGAHIAGSTGHNTLGLSVGKVGRITGLDPAGFGFGKLFPPSKFRIDKSQAEYVDIIHTNSCDIPIVCWGLPEVVGTADFFPNGGIKQPGCSDDSYCSHARSGFLFAESIIASTGDFQSWHCKNWGKYIEGNCIDSGEEFIDMGFFTTGRARGVYYLSTNAEPPFGKAEKQM